MKKPVIVIFIAVFIPLLLSATLFHYPYIPINLSELLGSVIWGFGLMAIGASLYSLLKKGD